MSVKVNNAEQYFAQYDSKKIAKYENEKIGKEIKDIINDCIDMSNAYDEILDEQNEYVMDFECELEEINFMQEELEIKIKQQKRREYELLEKNAEGTITDQEYSELESIESNIQGLTSSSNSVIDSKQNNLAKNYQSLQGKYQNANYAKRLSDIALKKGETLANIKNTNQIPDSVNISSFGIIGLHKKFLAYLGNNAIKAGSELADKISTSSKMNNFVDKNIKK